MNIALCFCVRDCGIYLHDVFKNIESLKTLNFNIFCIFVYDNCTDNSEELLINYKNKNNDYVIIKQLTNESKIRTERIAKARNECLNIVYHKLKNISFHIMIDSDDIGAQKWNVDIIDKYLNNFDDDNWDCISFNKKPYYDIWALLYDNFYHHCWGYGKSSSKVAEVMQKDITKKIKNSKSNSIEVMSAFNGFCIYKTERFKDFYYDGMYNNFKDLLTDYQRNKTLKVLKKKFNLDVNIGTREKIPHCEHLFYHISAFKKGRKIKISKFIIS